MNLTKPILFVLTSFLSFFLNKSTAQGLEIGGGLGLTHYKGELYPNFKPFAFHGGTNAFVRYNFVKQGVSVKGTGMIGYLAADDKRVNAPFNQARGFSFITNIMDAGMQIEYNFLNFRSTAMHDSRWTPYVFGGLNYYTVFNSKYEVDPDVPFVFNQYNTTISKRRGGYAIPFGIGFKKAIRPQLNLSVEFGTRKTYRDSLIDNFGYQEDSDNRGEIISNFASSIKSSNEQERKISTPNTRLNDMYYYTNISLSYVFYKVHCPPSR